MENIHTDARVYCACVKRILRTMIEWVQSIAMLHCPKLSLIYITNMFLGLFFIDKEFLRLSTRALSSCFFGWLTCADQSNIISHNTTIFPKHTHVHVFQILTVNLFVKNVVTVVFVLDFRNHKTCQELRTISLRTQGLGQLFCLKASTERVRPLFCFIFHNSLASVRVDPILSYKSSPE